MKLYSSIFLFFFLINHLWSNSDPFKTDYRYDVPLFGFSLLFFAGAQHEFSQLTTIKITQSENNLNINKDLPDYEHWVTRQNSEVADLASDILTIGALTPLAISYFKTRTTKDWQWLVNDVFMFGEAFALSSAINLFFRANGKQPRPLVYNTDNSDKERQKPQNSSSFYSGHTSAAFLTATYTSYVFQKRNPNSVWNKWIWLGTHSIATGMGALRMSAGKHFLRDVVTGAAVGSLIGYCIPRIHLSKSNRVSLLVSPNHGLIAMRF